MACILDLPPEILFSGVVPRVCPIDVLILGQTCQILRSMLSQKSIWEDILRSTCHIHGLFFASYPIDEMSISELQRASTGPHRWDSLLRRKAVPLEELKTAPPLPILASGSFGHWGRSPVDKFEVRAHIVPGGRFFVALRAERAYESTKATRLELWNLGIPMRRTNAAPTRLSYIYLEKEWTPGSSEGDLFITTSREDPNELRVAVSSRGGLDGLKIRVFSISPTQSSPRFEPLASARFNGLVEFGPGGFMHGNFMALRGFHADAVVLWNYVEGRLTKVLLASRNNKVRPILGNIAILTNDHLLHLGEDISVWSLSRLRDLAEPTPPAAISPGSIKTHLDLLPDWTCPYPFPVIHSPHRVTFIRPARCTVGSEPSVAFDVLTGWDDLWRNPITFHRYMLAESLTRDGAPFHFTHIEEGILPFGYFPKMFLVGGRIRNNGACMTYMAPETSRATTPHSATPALISVPRAVAYTDTLDGGGHLRRPLSDDDLKAVGMAPLKPLRPFTSCWASGRFIYHSYESGADSLLLADYL